jgi:tetratricopeptide (TPR) repeat protein
MQSDDLADAPLQDYPERSVWTTWVISYQAVRKKHKLTANLLLLWSFLDNKDLWHGLFAAACKASTGAKSMLLAWVGDVANNEIAFSRAMQLLRNYSLVEEVESTGGYATHPVVHRWAYHYQGKQSKCELGRVAVAAVGCAVPEQSKSYWAALQRRLLPHAQACSAYAASGQLVQLSNSNNSHETNLSGIEEREVVLDGTHMLGLLYTNQGRLAEAEQMYERALRGYEEALGVGHSSTLNTVNNLGALYAAQGRLAEAEKMCKWALQGTKDTLDPKHTSVLQKLNNLGNLYVAQGRLAEAEELYERALQGKENALGPKHTSTLDTVNNLGILYATQSRLAEAEMMYKRALQGKKNVLGPKHTSTLETVNNLGGLYARQGKLAEAEEMFEWALQGYEEALGPKHTSTLDTVNNLGILYARQGKLAEAEEMYERALHGYEDAIGDAHVRQYMPALTTLENMGDLYIKQGKHVEAQEAYLNALAGLQSVLGQSSERCEQLLAKMHAFFTPKASYVRRTKS